MIYGVCQDKFNLQTIVKFLNTKFWYYVKIAQLYICKLNPLVFSPFFLRKAKIMSNKLKKEIAILSYSWPRWLKRYFWLTIKLTAPLLIIFIFLHAFM